TDADSTPDTDTGRDDGPGLGTDPNDDVTNHNDIGFDNDTDTPLPQDATDEDDNDYEDIDIDVVYDLALVKVVTNVSPVRSTDTVTWAIRVRNQGNVASGAYSVTDTLPTGMVFATASNGGVASGQVVRWTDLPSLAPGEEVTLSVTTTIGTIHTGDYRNWAEISADSAHTYSGGGATVTDADSTPDADTGADDTLP
ncbi:MAG TPA: hypothetical protein PLV68_09610, partial [Ilumatobacteraceae bacterium]|nr:hypothetical protein [Ilumatobacteraceae bacterium]